MPGLVEPLCGILPDLLEPLPQATEPPTLLCRAAWMNSSERGDDTELPLGFLGQEAIAPA